MSLNEVDANDENTDLRIRKTRRAIRTGFLAVCENKPYDKVTVTDICTASLVSRTTFYDHYVDKDAVLTEVVTLFIKQMTPAIKGLWLQDTRMSDPEKLRHDLANFYAQNGHELKTLLSLRRGAEGDLSAQIANMCRTVFDQWARGRIKESLLPLASDIYASVVLTFIERGASEALTNEELSLIGTLQSLIIEATAPNPHDAGVSGGEVTTKR